MMSLALRITIYLTLGLLLLSQLNEGRAVPATAPTVSLKRGISIHEALNWPEMTVGPNPEYVRPPFASARYQLSPSGLTLLKELGFDHVRLTVAPGIFLASNESESRELDAILLARVRTILSSGLNVVVDFHPVKQDPRFPPLAFTRGIGEPLVESYGRMLARAASLLSDLPKGRVALEIMNEPEVADWSNSELTQWRRTLHSYYDAVRASAPELTLVLTGCCSYWGNDLSIFRPGEYTDRNVYFTFHFYSPHAFTHQGGPSPLGAPSGSQLIQGVPFPADPGQIDKIATAAHQLLARSGGAQGLARIRASRDLDKLIGRLREFSTPEQVDQAFDRIIASAASAGIDPVQLYLGEFGVMRTGTPAQSRANWLTAVRRAAERHGVGWAYWSLDGPQYMGMRLDARTWELDPLIIKSLGLPSHR